MTGRRDPRAREAPKAREEKEIERRTRTGRVRENVA
jgi:hypothetical protein